MPTHKEWKKSCQRLQYLLQVRRQGRLALYRLLRQRVLQLQAEGVQGLTLQPGNRLAAIDGIGQ